jgi:GAF domain-containing protein
LIENQRLFERTQEALEEVEATHRLYLREQWEQFVPAQVSPIYERSRRDLQPLDGDLPREVEQAMQHGKVVVSSDGDRESALVAPLTLRGEVIGALGLQDPEGERQWTEEEQLLVESVAEQLALALENARLLEETQRRAQRDHLVADITSEVRASSDMEGILRTAVRELGTVLDVDRARIHLRTEAEELESEGETRGSTIESSTEV